MKIDLGGQAHVREQSNMRLRVAADQASVSKTGAGTLKQGNMRLRVEADQASVRQRQVGENRGT